MDRITDEMFAHASRPCPICGELLDRLSEPEGKPTEGPKPGDVTVCLYCAGVLEIDENLEYIEGDILKLDKETQREILRIRLALNKVKRNRGE
jgi:hypothetical protein